MDNINTAKVVVEKAAVEDIVNSFVENAFRVMNPDIETANTKCHNCNLNQSTKSLLFSVTLPIVC